MPPTTTYIHSESLMWNLLWGRNKYKSTKIIKFLSHFSFYSGTTLLRQIDLLESQADEYINMDGDLIWPKSWRWEVEVQLHIYALHFLLKYLIWDYLNHTWLNNFSLYVLYWNYMGQQISQHSGRMVQVQHLHGGRNYMDNPKAYEEQHGSEKASTPMVYKHQIQTLP